MTTLWMIGDALVVDGSGLPIDCEECPCDEEEVETTPTDCACCDDDEAPTNLLITIPNDFTGALECDNAECAAGAGAFMLSYGLLGNPAACGLFDFGTCVAGDPCQQLSWRYLFASPTDYCDWCGLGAWVIELEDTCELWVALHGFEGDSINTIRWKKTFAKPFNCVADLLGEVEIPFDSQQTCESVEGQTCSWGGASITLQAA